MRIDLERVAFPLVLASLLVAGASPAQRSTQENRLAALEAQVADLKVSQDTALSRLNQVRLDLNNTLEPFRVRLADYGEDIRGMESALAALEEQLVLMNERLADMATQLSAGARPGARQAATGTPMPPPQRPTGVPAPSVAQQPRPPERDLRPRSEADALYSSAYTDYLAANYPLAISGFEEHMRLFPGSEQADNAQFWIGESYYSQQQFQLARTAFLEVPRRFSRSEMVPDSYLKAALCLIDIGELDRAQDELARLVRQHPRSNAAPIACMQIEKMGGEKPLGCPGI